MNSEHSYQESYSILVKHRPIRKAYLVNPIQTPEKLLNEIIKNNFEQWGGRYNLIIPTDGVNISDSFWNLLILTDPDIVYSFVNMDKDLVDRIDREVSPYLFDYKDIESLVNNHYYLSDSEFSMNNSPIIHQILHSTINPYFVEKPLLIVFKIDEDDPNYDLILWNFGIQHKMLNKWKSWKENKWHIDVVEKYQDIERVEFYQNMNLSEIFTRLSNQQTVFPSFVISESPGSFVPYDYKDRDKGFLLAIGNNSLNKLYLWNRIHILDECYRKVLCQLWIPESLLSDKEAFGSLIIFINKTVGGFSEDAQRVILVSSDKNRKELDEISDSLKKGINASIKVEIRCSSENFQFPLIKLDDPLLSFQKQGELFKVHGKKVILPNNPPIDISDDNPLESGSIMVDLDIMYHPEQFFYTDTQYWFNLPRKTGITHLFTDKPSRINRKGNISLKIEAKNRNIEITIPENVDIFYQLVSPYYGSFYNKDIRGKNETSFGNIELSDKGQYLRGVLGLFPSVWHASQFFSNRFWRDIFEDLSSIKKNTKVNLMIEIRNKVDKGFQFLNNDFETITEDSKVFFTNYLFELLNKVKGVDYNFISLDKFARRLKKERDEFKTKFDENNRFSNTEDELSRDLKEALQELTEEKILIQGVRPKCMKCGYRNWYSLEEISSIVICKGCHSSFFLPVESKWFYKLNELMKNTIIHQGVMPTLLCLGEVLNNSRSSFIYSPNLSLFKNRDDRAETAELDIVCISDGKFIIGEVKNSGSLFNPSEFAKMYELAKIIRPDKVLMYAFKAPYERAVELTKELKSNLSDYHIDVEFLHAPESIDDPQFNI
jgi:hypothetical protein